MIIKADRFYKWEKVSSVYHHLLCLQGRCSLSSPLRFHITSCKRTSCDSLTSTFILDKQKPSSCQLQLLKTFLIFSKKPLLFKASGCAEGNRDFQRFFGSCSKSPVEEGVASLFLFPRRRNWSTEQGNAWSEVTKRDLGSFSRGREAVHLLSLASWVITSCWSQPTSFSNFPPPGAVPPVFPCVAQQHLRHVGCSCSSALTP